LHVHWETFLQNDTELQEIFTNNKPQLVYKKHKTLSAYLTSATHPPRWQLYTNLQDKQNINNLAMLLQQNATNPVSGCNHPRCKCCTHITNLSNLSIFNQYPIHNNQILTCNSHNIIYLIHCAKCNTNYVGETKRSLKERLTNHRSTIKTNKPTAIAIHFNLPQHNILHLQIMPIEQLNTNTSDQVRQAKEKEWIKRLRTTYPQGLNNYPLIKQ
jgi:desmoglein 4